MKEMASVLKFWRLYSKRHSHALRCLSSFKRLSLGSSVYACNRQFHTFFMFKSRTIRVKCELLHSQVALYQKRYFRISQVLCADEIVKTPEFPESIAEGDIRWEKKVGDSVKVDDVVCEIETDKTAIPVPSPAEGVIAELFFKDGDTVKAGSQLFRMTVGGAPSGAPPAKAAPPPPKAAAPPPPKAAAPPPPKAAPPPPPKAAAPPPPKAAPPPPPKAAPPPGGVPPGALVRVPPKDPTKEIAGTRSETAVKMNRMRMKTAARLKESQNETAMLTTFNEIDMSNIIAFRKTHQDAFTKKHGIKMGFMSPFVKACVYALQDQPVVNAVIEGQSIIYRDYIDISIAVSTPKGLVVPVLRNVDYMNFGDIEKAIFNLGKKARDGKLAIEDMTGGTFTISNGGVFGSLLSTPIINPPQSAILGMHATFERPVAIKGKIVIRPMMYIALTYDHRLIDGREAVYFLRKIKAGVEDPGIIVAGV